MTSNQGGLCIWMSKEFKNDGRLDFCFSKPLFRDPLGEEHVLLRVTCLQEVLLNHMLPSLLQVVLEWVLEAY